MSGLALSLERYRIPLRRALRVGKRELHEREGLVLSLRDRAGAVGHGDVAPLPGLHKESLAEARAWLEHLDLSGGDTLGSLRRPIIEAGWDVPTSAWFALEAAYVALESDRRKQTPAAMLAEAPLARVAVNALFDGTAVAATAAIDAGAFDGYRTVKVKIGRRDPAEERAMLKALADGLPRATLLRLDGNRALTLDTAAAVFDGVPPERIEYVEDPLESGRDLDTFHARTGLFIALDESLANEDALALLDKPYVTTVVLKPAMWGGVLETLSGAEQAKERGKAVVISSCFESGLGLGFLAQLAAAVMEDGVAAGLSTDRWLAADTVAPPFDTQSGWIDTTTWSPLVTFVRPK